MNAFADFLDAALTRPAIAVPVGRWLAAARERRALSRLDAAALADLGLTRGAAAREAARPFWDLPRGR